MAEVLFAYLPVSGLNRLDLSDNALTSLSVSRLATMLALDSCPLEFLSLRDNDIISIPPPAPAPPRRGRRGAAVAAGKRPSQPHPECAFGQLLASLASNCRLRLLDLGRNELSLSFVTRDHLAAFQTNPTLDCLLLDDNRLLIDEATSEMFTVFLQCLPHCLQILNLSLVGIDSFQTEAICDAINEHPHLKCLLLADNVLGVDSCPRFARFLRENEKVRYLDISHNQFWDNGTRLLAAGLEYNTGLIGLRLDRNGMGRAALDLLQAIKRSRESSRSILK